MKSVPDIPIFFNDTARGSDDKTLLRRTVAGRISIFKQPIRASFISTRLQPGGGGDAAAKPFQRFARS